MLDRPMTIQEAYEARPRLWWLYTLIVLIVASLLTWSGTTVEWEGFATKGIEVAKGVGNGLIHPDMNLLINMTDQGVPYQLFQTVAIAVLGTLIGGILAVPFAFLASDKILPKTLFRVKGVNIPNPLPFLVNVVILLIRTIPSLVWALVWIRVTGPNAFCGVVTQAVCSIGMITKMYITAIEDIDTRILESLDASGCTTFQKIRYGILPQIIPNFISTVIYRFDINVKDATTLGIVGAGGIGAALIQCINSSRWSMVGAYLCGMVILMLFIEFFSTKIRNRLTRG
ncbi:MAG: ABC transporter permease [Clostridia bacterium]|nr:ABC transporter permease [Clostridia bacterium]